ncbi:leucine--tRNA ligase, partial [Candidatus Pacearchaeota archaeon]
VNPLTKEKVPVYVGNFVVADYGSGMVMAVPAHDQRDFEFAKKYKIPIRVVIQDKEKSIKAEDMEKAYTEEGILVNSGKFNGLKSKEAIKKISEYIEKKGLGKRKINYKLKDWLISRQRYWGTPIPIIYCDKCGVVPVDEKDLPVLLPEKVNFKTGKNPLTSNKDFVNVKCPKCNGKAKRETDTMGGFVDSSWYFLRYCDNKNKKEPFNKKKIEYWMPVDQYIGGAEHAVMHLMYARFFTKVLKDLGFVKINEPFAKLFNQGIVYKDGKKMSKSYGNVVFQTDISNKYGIDTARLFLMFVASPDKQMEWSDEGVEGSFRIINKLIRLKDKITKTQNARQDNKIHSAIKKVTQSIQGFEYPKAILAILTAVDYCSEGISRVNYEILLKLIHPFCPHITEEIWEKLGNKNFISLEKWPKADEKKINKKFEEQDQVIEKLIEDINNIVKIIESRGEKKNNIYVYVLPNEKEIYEEESISKKIGMKVKIFSVNDKDKYDPTNKSKNTKPGKPAIYLE